MKNTNLNPLKTNSPIGRATFLVVVIIYFALARLVQLSPRLEFSWAYRVLVSGHASAELFFAKWFILDPIALSTSTLIFEPVGGLVDSIFRLGFAFACAAMILFTLKRIRDTRITAWCIAICALPHIGAPILWAILLFAKSRQTHIIQEMPNDE